MKRKIPIAMAIAIILIAVAVFAVANFVLSVQRQEISLADANLCYSASSNAQAVYVEMMGYLKSLSVAARALEEIGNITSPEALSMLADIAKMESFTIMSVDTLDGLSYYTDGRVIDTSFLGIPDMIRQGKANIMDVQDSVIHGEPVLNMVVPIKNKSGEPIAQLHAAFKTKELSARLTLSVHNNHSFFYILDSNGRSLDDGYSAAPVSAELSLRKAFQTQFVHNGTMVSAHFAPIDIAGWNFALFEPVDYVQNATDVIVRYAMDMVLLLSVVVVAIILYFVHNLRERKKSMAQLDKMMEKAVLDERCFRALAAHCGMVVVEWNYSFTKEREYKVYEELINIDINEKKDYNDKITPEMIHPEDVELHRSLLRDIVAGVIDRLSIRIRVLTRDGSYRWMEHSSVTITDDNGKPYKAIGFFEDIDEEVRKEESLNQLAQTDPLTRLYNKEATRLLIEETLKEATHGELLAMICFDLDNFKSINDNFGHLYGDEVLMDVSRKIKELFRSSDVLGRFGGDEFVLLVKNPPSIDFIKEKTQALCDSVRETYTIEGVSLTVSASVGVAVYPKDGTNYEDLYKKADEASYEVKRSGKDKFLFYKN